MTETFRLNYKKSRGSWIVDQDGAVRLDCFSQYASQPLGWNHQKVQDRISRLYDVCMQNPANSDVDTDEKLKFIETFKTFIPDFKHSFFISGGTLGVENAMKAAFDWKMRLLGLDETEAYFKMDVIHFKHAFHGRSGYTLSMTNTHDPNKYKLFPKFDWTRIDGENLNHIEETLKKNLVASIVIEPIQGEGGDRHFNKEFLQELKKLADRYNAMLIFDEVQTGMGMTGKVWCYEHFDMIPDMICFGKKTQVCGFACTDKIDLVKDNVFNVPSRLCSTWGGNLVDMVRSTIFMEIIKEDNLVENARVVGDYLLKNLSTLGLSNLRGRGLMIAFDRPDRDDFIKKLNEDMFALKCGESSIRLRPHLTFCQSDADKAKSYIEKHL